MPALRTVDVPSTPPETNDIRRLVELGRRQPLRPAGRPSEIGRILSMRWRNARLAAEPPGRKRAMCGLGEQPPAVRRQLALEVEFAARQQEQVGAIDVREIAPCRSPRSAPPTGSRSRCGASAGPNRGCPDPGAPVEQAAHQQAPRRQLRRSGTISDRSGARSARLSVAKFGTESVMKPEPDSPAAA